MRASLVNGIFETVLLRFKNMIDKDILDKKNQDLRKYLRSLGSVAIAFSSGVDSTFLLKIAHEELGDKAIAVTATSCSFPKRESDEAANFCKSNGIKQITVVSEELNIPEFRHNPPNRCYLCKKELLFLQRLGKQFG